MFHITQQLALFDKLLKCLNQTSANTGWRIIGNIEFPNPAKHSIDVNFTIKSHF